MTHPNHSPSAATPIRESSTSMHLWVFVSVCAVLSSIGTLFLRIDEFYAHVVHFFTYSPPAPCERAGCPCASFNGQTGEYCCISCRNGYACRRAFHHGPPSGPPHRRVMRLDPSWPAQACAHGRGWMTTTLDALVFRLSPSFCLLTTPAGWLLGVAPRIRVGQRALLPLAILVVISWLALPADALSPHHADSDQFYPAPRPANPDPSPGTACPGAGRSGNVGVFNGFLSSGKRVTVGPDTFCDVSMITPECVDPTWPTQKVQHPIWLDGIWGTRRIGHRG